MRSGDFRAYYGISGNEVVILAVTRRKDDDMRLKRIAEETGPGCGRSADRAGPLRALTSLRKGD
jgi:hypothetical protein